MDFFNNRKNKKRTVLFFLIFSLLVPSVLYARDLFLVEAEFPSLAGNRELEIFALADLESGAIPAMQVKPTVLFSLFDPLQLSASPIMIYFLNTEDFLFTGWEASLRLRILSPEKHPFLLHGYAKVRHIFAEPYTVPYEGDLPQVHTVISPHTDTGLDLIGGVTGMIPLTYGSLPGGLLFTADYARTINRTYNPLFDQEGCKNRIFLDASPALFFPLGKEKPLECTLLAQNRFTLWFERGFMYDFMPQLNIMFSPAFSVVIGGSVPIVGGGVFKVYAGSRVGIPLERERRIVIRDIYFPPNKAILFGSQNEKSKENTEILDRLYQQLEKYPEYSIVVEGHTSFVFWNDPVKGPLEQKETLIPLSYARANAVLEALVARGIPRSRITAVGKGGEEPIVPFSRKNKQWKNRRVEIRLIKP